MRPNRDDLAAPEHALVTISDCGSACSPILPSGNGAGEPPLVELVQTGKLAAVGELAAGVAHEINNPLFAILGLVEFLIEDAEPGSKTLERLQLIQTTAGEIKGLVRALQEFVRERSDDVAVVSVADTVRTGLDLIRRTNAAKSVEIVDVYEPVPTPVNVSPNQLKQVLLNLVANARQAMPDGGTIQVAVTRRRGSVAVSVADNGPGIPASVLPQIFQPFFTTRSHAGGTGLGLAASLGIARAHGGTIEAANRSGGGAVFTLLLPLAEEAV
jgi:two-component system, NtrC family, sensor kinase